jgi:TRAP-type C4-dicarboxylate transport system permease small subunit
MRSILIAAAAFIVGAAFGIVLSAATIRHLRRRLKELRAGQERPNIIRSITRFLFVTAQVFAIVWVTWSYVIATYSTVVLMQPFPAEELSREAVRTILGVGVLKVVENVFEHNNGRVFGHSRTEDNLSNEDGEEGGIG